jgi:hypothetical protein
MGLRLELGFGFRFGFGFGFGLGFEFGFDVGERNIYLLKIYCYFVILNFN